MCTSFATHVHAMCTDGVDFSSDFHCNLSKTYIIQSIVVIHAFHLHLDQNMRFPTMWHFDMCRLGRASDASF